MLQDVQFHLQLPLQKDTGVPEVLSDICHSNMDIFIPDISRELKPRIFQKKNAPQPMEVHVVICVQGDDLGLQISLEENSS